MFFNLVAVVLSVLALAISTYLALHQNQIQRRANYLSACTGMFAGFRSAAFHDHYLFVTETLPSAYDPQLGISGLPEEARIAVYDMAYFFQNLAQLRLLRILDEEIFAQLHIRIIRVWDAIAPIRPARAPSHHRGLPAAHTRSLRRRCPRDANRIRQPPLAAASDPSASD
ncbi:MAG TPA: hypothetical protein VGS19_11015 [Streptosporangiaceae bacterium]|nr:hypothetical protein [Streptosporangiaceae bacterium]